MSTEHDRSSLRWRLGEAVTAPETPTAEEQARHFRDVLGTFATGVAVVTSLDGAQPIGMTCQSLASVSLTPPLVLFCPARTSHSWPLMRRSGFFCANILAADASPLSDCMATKGAHKFDGVDWKGGQTGAPILADALAWIECAIVAVHEAGDHDVVIGRVLDLDVRDGADLGDPLLFHRGEYARLTR